MEFEIGEFLATTSPPAVVALKSRFPADWVACYLFSYSFRSLLSLVNFPKTKFWAVSRSYFFTSK